MSGVISDVVREIYYILVSKHKTMRHYKGKEGNPPPPPDGHGHDKDMHITSIDSRHRPGHIRHGRRDYFIDRKRPDGHEEEVTGAHLVDYLTKVKIGPIEARMQQELASASPLLQQLGRQDENELSKLNVIRTNVENGQYAEILPILRSDIAEMSENAAYMQGKLDGQLPNDGYYNELIKEIDRLKSELTTHNEYEPTPVDQVNALRIDLEYTESILRTGTVRGKLEQQLELTNHSINMLNKYLKFAEANTPEEERLPEAMDEEQKIPEDATNIIKSTKRIISEGTLPIENKVYVPVNGLVNEPLFISIRKTFLATYKQILTDVYKKKPEVDPEEYYNIVQQALSGLPIKRADGESFERLTQTIEYQGAARIALEQPQQEDIGITEEQTESKPPGGWLRRHLPWSWKKRKH